MLGIKLHREVVLVDDRVMAATLIAIGHSPLALFQDTTEKFYSVFPITRELRDNIRAYYDGRLIVNVLKLNEYVEQISMSLEDFERDIHDRLCSTYQPHDQ